jgi:nitrite reductase (NADH) small subunit
MAAAPIDLPPNPRSGSEPPAMSADESASSLDAKLSSDARWFDVCRVDDITPDTGVAALIGGHQIAIVRVGQGDEQRIFAVGNYDPFSKAFVIARGIVGDRAGVPKIASPIFKQNFDLRTGQCLDDPSVRLPSYPVQVRDGRIAISIAPEGARTP